MVENLEALFLLNDKYDSLRAIIWDIEDIYSFI